MGDHLLQARQEAGAGVYSQPGYNKEKDIRGKKSEAEMRVGHTNN